MENQVGTVWDEDGNKYPILKLKDNRLWLGKNLNVALEGAFCYEDDEAIAKRFGRLYTWESACKACASLGLGWYLPTVEEWEDLALAYGGLDREVAYGSTEIMGNSRASFDALAGENTPSAFIKYLGGRRGGKDNYGFLNQEACFWTRTNYEYDEAYFLGFFQFSGTIFESTSPTKYAFSCRCIHEKDSE